MKKTIVVAIIFALGFSCAWADAPVVDITEGDAMPAQNAASAAPAAPAQAADLYGSSNADTPVMNNSTPVVNDNSASANAAGAYHAPASNAPVYAPAATRSMSSDQRLAQLEQQMANLVQMNLPQQIADMQQTLNNLQGQLQVQQRDLKNLTEQQQTFYKDLDERLAQLKGKTLAKNSVKKKSAPSVASAAADDTASESDNSAAAVADPNPTVKSAGNDAADYQKAFNLLTSKQYPKAKVALQNYVKNYPNGKFIANAHYWLGETHLSLKSYQYAAKEFATVIQKYPSSPRLSDAKLKLAIAHIHLGRAAQARNELKQVKKQYPDSTAAQLATIQLQQLDIDNT